MLKLEEHRYNLVEESLIKVEINNLFARSVLTKQVSGLIFVDNKQQPRTFYLLHPYGMSLLFGESDNRKFNLSFREYALNKNGSRKNIEWMQIYPNNWQNTITNLFADDIVTSGIRVPYEGGIQVYTRVNFKFSKERYLRFKTDLNATDAVIVRINDKYFHEMRGAVVPKHFWKDEKQFLFRGIGYGAIYKDTLAALSFSAFIHDNMLELGIETRSNYRRMGFAYLVCSRLIDFCISHGYEPVWSCREDNLGSYRLALRLGFEPTLRVPYYKLGC